MQPLEGRLGIEGVDVRGAALHHQEDAPLRLGRQLLRPRRERTCRQGIIARRPQPRLFATSQVAGHHRRQGNTAE